MRRLAPAVLFLTFVAACRPSTTELTDEQTAEIREAVTVASAEFTEAFRTEDIERYMSVVSGWAKSPWGCCKTLEDLRSYVTANWERWQAESVENGEMKVLVLGPDAAVVAFTQTNVSVDTAGVKREMESDLAFLWVREAGQWKLVLGKQYSERIGP